jgi:BolA protein
MSVSAAIENKLRQGLPVEHLEVVNESHMHNVPANSETHFRVVVVSGAFDGQMPVRRHQQVYSLLDEEMAGPVHALALHTLTPAEWRQREGVTEASPACRGGSKHDPEFGR